MAQRPYIVGNWKMHGTRAMLAEGARDRSRAAERLPDADVALAPPYTLIHATRAEAAQIGVGAQDCHPADGGAHTGDISAAMLKDAGAEFVIVGHSERRADHGESDALVRGQGRSRARGGLSAIVCASVKPKRSDAGQAESVCRQPARRPAADRRRRGGESDRGLRTRVGDRHRPHPHRGRRSRDAPPRSASCWLEAIFGEGAEAGVRILWRRLGQTRKRRARGGGGCSPPIRSAGPWWGARA